jgi:hypothetical protein
MYLNSRNLRLLRCFCLTARSKCRLAYTGSALVYPALRMRLCTVYSLASNMRSVLMSSDEIQSHADMKSLLRTRDKAAARESVSACHVESLPNSSAIFSVALLANAEDVVAMARTALLLGGSLRTAVSISFVDERLIDLVPDAGLHDGSLDSHLSIVMARINTRRTLTCERPFALELSITSASFLTVGTISLQIRLADSQPTKLSMAR